MPKTTLISVAALVVATLTPLREAQAERNMDLLMSMDHHLARADFIGVVTVDAQGLYTNDSGLPLQSVAVQVDAVLHSRWAPTDGLDFITDAGFEHFEFGRQYLVLMSGGAWNESPFTHRVNSVFVVEEDGTLSCSGGDRLYGVLGDGFYCAPSGSVIGEPLTLDQATDALDCARQRAVFRLPTLTAELDADPRELQLEPSAVEELEVRR